MLGTELLAGATIALAPLEAEHAPQIAQWFSNAEFLRRYGSDAAYPKSTAELAKQIANWRENPNQFMFGIRRQAGGVLVGLCGYDQVSWRNGVGWVVIGVDPSHWHKGYGTAAMRLLLQYGFQELRLHKAQLTVFAYNENALAMYEKLGFQQEGRFREVVYRDGEHHDMVLMGLLRSEWLASQNGA